VTKFHNKMKNFYIKKNLTEPNCVGDFVIAYNAHDDMSLGEYTMLLVLGKKDRQDGLTDYTLFSANSNQIIRTIRPTKIPDSNKMNSVYLVNTKDIILYSALYDNHVGG
jgi:hypothetical protein